jgi:hypothetical protein
MTLHSLKNSASAADQQARSVAISATLMSPGKA